jgi:sulfatase maturation enzyme AslB (radical SAM superfamily)
MMMATLFWEQSTQLDQDDLQTILTAVDNTVFNARFINAGGPHLPVGYQRAVTDNIYAFARMHSGETIMRLCDGGEPIPPNLLSKMLNQHASSKASYSYTDGKDLNRAIQVEIISDGALSRAHVHRFYPDGSLALFEIDGAFAYILDAEDYRFYYGEHFERFYWAPTCISIEPYSRCNLRCQMCCYQSEMYANAPIDAIPHEFSVDLHQRIICEVAGLNRPMSIEYCWRGEPMLAPHLFDMLGYAADKGIPPSLVTNATLLDDTRARQLLDTGVGAVTFSIDGASKQTYEAIRVGADYDRVIANVRRFIELAHSQTKRPVIVIKTCRQKKNETELDNLVAMWMDAVDMIVIQNQAFPGNEQFPRWFNPGSQQTLGGRRPPCRALWLNLVVSTTGNSAQCTTFFDEHPDDILGNLNHLGVQDIWLGDAFRSRRALALDKQFQNIPLCRECDGVTCSAITIKKKYVNDDIYVINSACYQVFSRPSNRLLYPKPEIGTSDHV